MLVDDVTITVKAGNGGNGARSFLHLPNSFKTPPDGGNGGHGGDIFIAGSHNVSDLSEFRFQKVIEGENGENGGTSNMYGKQGIDTTILLPFGTHVTDTENNETFEVVNEELILIAKGGAGGLGNKQLFSKPVKHQHKFSTEGKPGEEKQLHLELKYIADIGLVGYPNAGKSSMLSTLTNADPKIGDYEFTTIEPNLGVHQGATIADIPGLIEGASAGKGLGIQFLKHIEKTKILLHLIDSSHNDLIAQYNAIQGEFKHYKGGILLSKPQIIILSKSDLISAADMKKKIAEFKEKKLTAIPFSIYSERQIESLKKILAQQIKYATS